MTDTTPLIISQEPLPGAAIPPSNLIDIVLTLGPNPTGFDVNDTIISQYAQSPTLGQLIASMAGYFDPTTNLEAFYNYVWNVNTAQGFGLDIWGRIVNISRLLQIPVPDAPFGFFTGVQDFEPFNQAPFASEGSATQTFALSDDAYRTLIMVKAFANICATTAPAINTMLNTLFAGRGRCYVQDFGDMQMSYFFEFTLSPVEYAILTQTGVPPHPAGVLVSILQLDISGTFGFDGSGLQPFNQGTYFNGA